MSMLFSKLPALPAPEEPFPQATTSNPDPSHSTSGDRPNNSQKSGSNGGRHTKKPSISHRSVYSQQSGDSYASHGSSRKLWDTEDTFLPRAKPPPPLPKLDKHRRARSHHHIDSPPTRPSTSHGAYQQAQSASSRSASTEPSLEEEPILDISPERQTEVSPRPHKSLSRSNTRVTASSGTSDESSAWGKWKPPPSWAGPGADVGARADKESKLVRSLSRLGSRKRSRSRVRKGPDGLLSRPKSPEPEPELFELVDAVASGEHLERCPSSGVKIQYYQGWHEKPAEDVIHMLRELRLN